MSISFRKSILCAGFLALCTLPAAAQSYGQQGGYGQQSGYGQQAGSQEQQFLLGEWSLQTPRGRAVSVFKPDGTFMMMQYARGQQQGQFSQGRYQVKPMGGGRFELTAQAQMQGQRRPNQIKNTLRITQDGRLYNETSRAFAQRTGGY